MSANMLNESNNDDVTVTPAVLSQHHQHLISKWSHTQILDNLSQEKALNYAILFENQSKLILREIEDMHSRHRSCPRTWNQEAFNLAQQNVFPLIRRVFDGVDFEWKAMETPYEEGVGCAETSRLRTKFSLTDYEHRVQSEEFSRMDGLTVWFDIMVGQFIEEFNNIVLVDKASMAQYKNYDGPVGRHIHTPFLAASNSYGDRIPPNRRNKTYGTMWRGKTVPAKKVGPV